MNALDLVTLTQLMERTGGRPEITIGLVDGPVAIDHTNLMTEQIWTVPGAAVRSCTITNSVACQHGTFVAGILSARRESAAPAICPQCTLLVRPIFAEAASLSLSLPSATPEDLATAITECIDAGVQVLNLSLALTQSSKSGQAKLEDAFNRACQREVLIVAAAGNQGTVGSSAITRHPWVIPVAACDLRGRPVSQSNLGSSIARRGMLAPGDNITSLGVDGQTRTLSGTSAAAPFVTGTIALLWSEFPQATASQIKYAVSQAMVPRRASVVPPLLNAWSAYQWLAHTHRP